MFLRDNSAPSGPTAHSVTSEKSKGLIEKSTVSHQRDNSAPSGPTAHSVTSEKSKGLIEEFQDSHQRSKAGPGPSGVSLSSDRSKDLRVFFKKDQSGASAQSSTIPFGSTTASLGTGPSKGLTKDFKDSQQRDEDSNVPIGQEPQVVLKSIFKV
ncbi:hypothetical protein NL108_017704 [Boleophthalmus pectinirostris]|nr:hypothetical protein NL108_017704 [Boleophthalmus pectinirostris]